MKSKLVKYAPPGYDYSIDKNVFLIGLAIASLFSLTYFGHYVRESESLYLITTPTEKILNPNAIMMDFVYILDISLLGYFILAVCLLLLVVLRYLYYYQYSKSIYLMKRLPDKFDMHRRCVTMPLLLALICLGIAFFVLLLYFAHYMIFTPDSCIQPDQWMKIWSKRLGRVQYL